MDSKIYVLSAVVLFAILLFQVVVGKQSDLKVPRRAARERRQLESQHNCQDINNPCKGKGICDAKDPEKCICHSRLFEGDNCDQRVKHCTPTTCMNGGTCEEYQATFFCSCTPQYEGVRCEKAQEEHNERGGGGHFIWYEMDIPEGSNQTFLIFVRDVTPLFRYEFSSGDGLKFNATDDAFDETNNARMLALQYFNINSEDIPSEQRSYIYVHHVYRSAGVYSLTIKILSFDVLVMETKLPVVVYSNPAKCVPQISAIHGCGTSFDTEVSYFRAMTFSFYPRVTTGCTNTRVEFKWHYYMRVYPYEYPCAENYVESDDTFLHSVEKIGRPYTFLDSGYLFIMVVKEIDDKNMERTATNAAMCWFKIIHRPPQAVISGGNQRTVDWRKEFVVDGSSSTDIDTDPASRHLIVWKFTWSCWNSKHPEISENFCKGRNATLPITGSTVVVPGEALKANETYIFSLTASVGEKVSIPVQQEIIAVVKTVVALELRCKKNCADFVLPLESVIYEVACPSCEGHKVSYSWTMVPGSSNKKKEIDWEKEVERGRNSKLLIISSECLLPGDVYNFTVDVTVDDLHQEGSSGVTLNVHPGLVAGKCTISPEEGMSLITLFTIKCEGFEDNLEKSNAALLYQFFQKSLGDDGEESLSLLDQDTEAIGEKLILMPGDVHKDYTATIVIKVSNHIAMNAMYNLTVKVEPLISSSDDINVAEEYIETFTSGSEDSILHMLQSGNVPEAMQYVHALTELMSGIEGTDDDQIADTYNNLRGQLLDILSEVSMETLSDVKLVSNALHKVASPWAGEKSEGSKTEEKGMFNVSSVLAESAGELIFKLATALSHEAVSQEDFYSTQDVNQVARQLMYVGDRYIIQNHSENLYPKDDDWNEDIPEQTPNRFGKEKNEDYPDYMEFDATYQDNLLNYKMASFWYLEALKSIGRSVAYYSYLEEKPVEVQNRNSFLCSKKFRAADLNGQKFGSADGFSGIKISKDFAEGFQYGSEDVFALEVTVMDSNPAWWTTASPSEPVVNSEVVFVNFKNLNAEDGTELVSSEVLGGVEVFLGLKSFEKEEVAGRNDSEIPEGDGADESDLTVHQIQIPDGASFILSFDPPSAPEDKLLVVVLKNHRPTREDFTEDLITELPSNLAKNDSYSIFVRGSFNEEDPGFPQFFYLAVLPHPSNRVPETKFSYKFSVNNILCSYYSAKLGKWLSDGCEVGKESSSGGIHCICTRMSSLYGAALSAAPNKIDPFSDVKLFLEVVENPVSVALVCTVLTLYIFLLIFARRKDLKDKRKAMVIYLEDNNPGDPFMYLITVSTGWGRECGTSANVSLRLQGTEGMSRIHSLATDGSEILQSGSEDWFLILCPWSLGELLNIRIWHDNYGDNPSCRYCKRVIVRELRGVDVKGVWIFLVDRWISVDGMVYETFPTGTVPCCKVAVATRAELRKWRDTFTEITLSSFSQNHIWISIFSRPAESTFTSCQRLSIATNLLMTAMLASIMFYGVAKKPGFQLDVGGFTISVTELLVSVQTVMITTIMNIPVAMLFRYSDPKEFKVSKIFSKHGNERTLVKDIVKEMENGASDSERQGIDVIAKRLVENEEKGFSVGSSENVKGGKRGLSDDAKLPNWCRLIGWILCISSILISAYFVCLYGLSYGKVKSLLWLSAVLMAIFQRSLVIQPLKILIFAVFQSYAMVLTGPGEEYLKKNPLAKNTPDQLLNKGIHRSNLMSSDGETTLPSIRRHWLRGDPPLTMQKLQMLASEERKWRETCSRFLDIMALIFFIISLYVVTYNTCDPLAWDNANMLEKIIISGLNKMAESRRKLETIAEYDHVFEYLNETALPALHASSGYGGLPFDEDEGWTSHLPSKLLGIPRLRQWRTSQGGVMQGSVCRYGPHWTPPSPVLLDERVEKMWNCFDPDENDGMYIIGSLDSYRDSGFEADLGRNLQNSRRVLQFIKDSGWVDEFTQALALEYSMYNVDRNLFSFGYVLIEKNHFGEFITSHQILSARLIEIHFGQKIWGTIGYLIFILATLLLFGRLCRRWYLSKVYGAPKLETSKEYDISTMPKWKRVIVVIFSPMPKGTSMVNELMGVFEERRRPVVRSGDEDPELKGLLSKKQLQIPVDPELRKSTPVYPRHPLSPPSLIEWILIGMSLPILVFYVLRNNAMNEPLERLDRGAAANERHKFVSLQLGVNWDYAFKYALACNVCVATSALWRVLPSFRHLPEKTLQHSGQGPLPTMLLCFGVVLIAFGCGGHVSSLLGSSTKDFSTISQSLSTLLGWAVGVQASKEIYDGSYFGKMLYCTFGIGCSVYVINLFLTIVMEEFERARREVKVIKEGDKKVFGVLEFGREFWQRKGFSCKSCFKMFKRKNNGVSNGKIRPKGKVNRGQIEKHGKRMKGKSPSKREGTQQIIEDEEGKENLGLETFEEDDASSTSGEDAAPSIQDYLRLRAGGRLTSTRGHQFQNETVAPRNGRSKFKLNRFHCDVRNLSVCWLKGNQDGGNPSKLSWMSTDDGHRIGHLKLSDGEELEHKIKAMAAITLVLSEQEISGIL
ncbi:polycystic kidney disease and receptor for egg jelly-related protein-like isoform X2 [Ischnura elegans]|uniref:polycystic kidney disease and receptor for egg jelly-related protein-like isoform X2 n=1 Tax=Ischnura elegans TaxID=197161 RepID=UPI001ED89AB8|nr:polycystic kidney disease and receptor for egg jelly-related protein-like isoform X2 [Ischnura elegans]